MFELAFITSSRVKLNHAIHLCRNYTVNIVGHREKYYGKGYEEPRIHERDELLRRSIEDALVRWRKNVANPDEKFFFIEDTSVIIRALSQDGAEVPGVDIKYWMQENDFKSVDETLKSYGNDRHVTVRSDVLLMLPKSLQKKNSLPYIRFTSKVSGTIADHEYDITTNPMNPWLDDKTFNKWFVPNGCSAPLSTLNIGDADKYDFRAGAFMGMLIFLEKKKKIRRKNERPPYSSMVQIGFPIGSPLFIVSGPTCSGKTTLAEFMIDRYGYYHIEASDFMYLRYFQKLGIGSSVRISDFAKQALAENPDIVVDEILKYIRSIGERAIIITGLRTPNEIHSFVSGYKGSHEIEILMIDAEEAIRLDRYLKRNRGGTTTKEKFFSDSQVQNKMGLGPLVEKYADSAILNNGSFDEYYNKFVDRYDGRFLNASPFLPLGGKKIKPSALEDAILMALFINESDFLTTAEIAKLINETFRDMNVEKSKNNVSRYFNQNFHPYFEAMNDGGVNKYRLSQTGRAHTRWLMHKKSSSS